LEKKRVPTADELLAEQATGCFDDAVTVNGYLFFGQFHFFEIK
jgi:hypothetical protein